MRGREVLMFAAGVLVGALLIGPIVWLMEDDVTPGSASPNTDEPVVETEPAREEIVPAVPRVERERVESPTPPAENEPSDYEFPPVGAGTHVVGKPGAYNLGSPGRVFLGAYDVPTAHNWWDAGATSLTPVATRALEQAEASAKALRALGKEYDVASIRALLASPEPERWEAGLALAAQHEPPLTDDLLALARDPSFGSMRVAAALALSRLDPKPEALGPLLVELSRDSDAWVVMAAVQLFPEVPEATATRAVEMLRDEPPRVLLVPLAHAAARSNDVDALLESPPTPSIGLAVAAHAALLSGLDDHPRRRAAIRRLLALPGTDKAAGWLFSTLEMLGSSAVLAEWYEARELPTATRVALLEATMRALLSAPSEGALRATERLVVSFSRDLADPNAPAALLLEGMAALGEVQAKEDVLVDALWTAQASHSSPFVREEARQRLRALGKGGSGELVVVSARYGLGDDWVDVAHELSQLVVGPSLRVRADNSIAGDPAFGKEKVLIVVYRSGGRLHRRAVREGQTLVLP